MSTHTAGVDSSGVDGSGRRGWSLREIEAEYVQRYAYPVARECAQDAVEEWDYAADPHGFCHDRSVLIALLAEIDRLEALLAQRGGDTPQ